MVKNDKIFNTYNKTIPVYGLLEMIETQCLNL